MKKYTSDEVIALHNQYMSTEYSRYYGEDAGELVVPFEQWLKEKEQSSLPVKDQLIWVKDEDHLSWKPRYFSHFEGKTILTYIHGCTSSETDEVSGWDEYSLTDPNQ